LHQPLRPSKVDQRPRQQLQLEALAEAWLEL